ncbi:MAG TPA: hypothetical protein VK988_05005 [Acidimicrobiales bacterium]|nr:hypothetical protein [Acidimicrobiales bacterium]
MASPALAACRDDDERVQAADTVTVEMSDFAYSVSGPLTAGATLRISNVGKEFHMMSIGKLKPGKTVQDLTRALSQAGPPGEGEGGPSTTAGAAPAAVGTTTTSASGGATTTESQGQGGNEEGDPAAEILDELGLPGNFMSPGESVDLRVPNLAPGTYALICFIPTEGEGSPHFAKGMIGELRVVEGKARPEPRADATYRLAPRQPVQGPATLSPGRHTLKFEAGPGSQPLEPSIVRLNPGATVGQLDAALAALFESEHPPATGATSQVPGQVVFGGFDLDDVTSFYLTVDLKPGNYVITAEDVDDENRPKPPIEMINITVG